MWAIMAAVLPLIALYHGKVRAMSGKCPAVVESPYDVDIVLFDIAEQERKIDVATVEVMEMEEVNMLFFQLMKQNKSRNM